MKPIILSLIFGFLALSCSRRDDPSANPVDQLPSATQTGANTIGCLVNGEVLLPYQSNPFGSPSKHCHYQFVNNEWNLGISFKNDEKPHIRSVGLFSNGNILNVGTYVLSKNNGQNGESKYGVYTDFNIPAGFSTNQIKTGELKITKLDTVHNIISGTFWFDAESSSGQTVQIREGRFDFTYTP